MAWSVLQSCGGGVAFGTFTSNLSAGSKLIFCVAAADASADTISSVDDGAGHSMALKGSSTQTSGYWVGNFIYALDTPAGLVGTKPTFTAHFTPGSPAAATVIFEVSGLAAEPSSLDGSVASATGTSGTPSTPVYGSAVSGEFLVATLGCGDGPTWAGPSGYTVDANSTNTNAGCDLGAAYKSSTGGTESNGWTWSAGSSANWVDLLGAFALAAAGAPPSPTAVAAAAPGRTWLRRFHHPQRIPLVIQGVTAAAPVLLPACPQHRAAAVTGRARLGARGALAAGILAVTTLSPQPSAVPPAKPQPSIAHPAPHRVIWRGISGPPSLPFLTAKLPPTAVSPRPPHRGTGKGILAKTTLSPQPSSVPAPLWRQPFAPRPAHRAIWRAIAGAAPPPPPFTIGALTAGDAALGQGGPQTGSSALTAATAATGAPAAGDKATGGGAASTAPLGGITGTDV